MRIRVVSHGERVTLAKNNSCPRQIACLMLGNSNRYEECFPRTGFPRGFGSFLHVLRKGGHRQ